MSVNPIRHKSWRRAKHGTDVKVARSKIFKHSAAETAGYLDFSRRVAHFCFDLVWSEKRTRETRLAPQIASCASANTTEIKNRDPPPHSRPVLCMAIMLRVTAISRASLAKETMSLGIPCPSPICTYCQCLLVRLTANAACKVVHFRFIP